MNPSQRQLELCREREELAERRERLLSERERLLRKVTDVTNDLMVAERKLTRALSNPPTPGYGEAKKDLLRVARSAKRMGNIREQRAERILEELEEVREAKLENAAARCENLLENVEEFGLEYADFRELASIYKTLTGEERLEPVSLWDSVDETADGDDWDPRELL